MILGGTPPLSTTRAQAPAPAPGPDGPPVAPATVPGRFLPVVEPITDATVADLRDAVLPFLASVAEETGGKVKPVLVFEFRPGDEAPGRSDFSSSYRLARFLAEELGHTEKTLVKTVAFVPKSLSGYAVLAALACDEIVMGPEATLGRIDTSEEPANNVIRAAVAELAEAKNRGTYLPLLLGMLEKDRDVFQVTTGDSVRYVLDRDLNAFEKEHPGGHAEPVWEAGNRGVVPAEKLRRMFVNLLAPDRAKVLEEYHLGSTSDLAADEPIAVSLEVHGPIRSDTVSYLRQRISEEVNRGANLIFLDISSGGGDLFAVEQVLDELAKPRKGVRIVGFVEDEALGLAALVPLACDEIVMKKGARIGEVTGRGGAEGIDPAVFADKARKFASVKGHPPAVAVAMIDPSVALVEAKNNENGAVVRLLSSEVDPKIHSNVRTIKEAGDPPIVLTSDNAQALGMAVRTVENEKELGRAYGLKGAPGPWARPGSIRWWTR